MDVKVGVKVKDGKRSAPAAKGVTTGPPPAAGNTTGNSTDSKTDYDYGDSSKYFFLKIYL